MANFTSVHTGATIDASVTIISGSGVTQSDLTKLNAVTSSAVELNILDGVTASTAEINILDGLTASTTELNYLDGADSSITTLSLPDNTTITTFGASLVDDADAATARTTLGVDVAGTDNSTDVTLVTTSYDYLSLSGQAITLGQIDISDDTNLVGGDGLALTGDTLSVNVDDSSLEINSDTLRVKASGVTNAMLANSSLSYGGVSVALGASDATPAFDLSDATSLPIVAGTTGTLSVARGGTGATTASGARTNLNVDVAGTDNSTDVTLVTTSHDYLSLSGQAVTLGQIDISDDTNLVGGTGITLTGDTLSTTDSEIVHDNLSGFVSNEHIDHSSVSITAGAGLTGGGDITTTRDIAVGAGTGVTVNADDIAIGQDVATSADVEFNSVTADIIGDIRGATKFQAKADVALNKGDAVYISGVSGTTPTVDIADANDSAKMPSFGLAASSVSINASVEIITFGTLSGINTSSFSVGDIIFISTNGTSGNTLTATAPSGESSLIQNIGIVQRSHASAGSIKVGGAGRTNATPNLDDGDIFIGNGSNQAVSASLNAKIESYLDGGTSTANFDTISVDGVEITATPAELNKMDGVTSTTAELNYTDGVTSNIQTQLDLKAPLASPAFTGTATGANLTLSGDLTVNGSTTTLDTTNLAVEDNLMELNAGVTSNANDSGFLIERGTTGDNAIFMWDESADKFTLGTTTATGTTTGDITLSSTGTLVANVEGNVTGAVTGNADTATTLATARNFSLTGDVTAGAVSFDGSGNVALATTIAANSVALGTDTTGNYMSDLTEGTGIDITHTPAEGSNGTITLDLTEVGFGGGANRLITDDGDGTVSTEANLTFDGSTLALTGDLNVGSGDFFVDDSTGNVGIGTQSPDAKLDITASGVNGVVINQDGSNADQSSRLFFKEQNSTIALYNTGDTFSFRTGATIDSTSGTQRFYINTSGATVAGNLNVSGNSFMNYGLVVNENANDADFRVEGTSDTHLLLTDAANNRVGIGTTSPAHKLEVEVDTNVFVGFDNSIGGTTGDKVMFVGWGGSNAYGRIQPIHQGTAYKDLVLNDGGGNVGIGTTAPGEKLEVSGNIKTTAHLVLPYGEINDAGTDLNIVGTNAVTLQSSAGTALTIPNASTNVGIGTTSPNHLLEIEGQTNDTEVVQISNDAGGSGSVTGITHLGITHFPGNTYSSTRITAIENGTASYTGHLAFSTRSANTDSAPAERMRIASSGNVGIGTISPTARLHISENGGSTDDAFVVNPDNGGNRTMTINGEKINVTYSNSGGAGPALVLQDNGGNVGIGTSSNINERLNVYHSSSADVLGIVGVGSAASTNFANINFRNLYSSATGDSAIIGCDTGSTTDKGELVFSTSGGSMNASEKMRITSGGNVGIGITNPASLLTVNGTARFNTATGSDPFWITRAGNTNESLRIYVDDSSAVFQTFQDETTGDRGNFVFVMDSDSTAYTDFRHGSATKMRIKSDGNVGIGIVSPQQKLHIFQTEGGVGAKHATIRLGGYLTVGAEIAAYRHTGNSNDQGLIFSTYHNTNGTTDTMTLDSNGLVGIGTTSPEVDLHIVDDTYSQLRVETSGAGNVEIETQANDNSDEAFFGTRSNHDLKFRTNWTNAMTIDTSQNVGIGTTSPDSKLQVEYTTTSNGSAAIAEFGTSGSGAIANSGHQVIVGGPSVSGYTGMMIYSDSTSGVGQISFADGRGANDSWRGTIAYEHANDRMEFWTNATEKIAINSDGDFIPAGDGTQDLGASSKRWGVIYSADLDLSNEGSQNDVDGTWGSYVIQEGEDDLFLINRRSGKKYKFMLQEVQD